jgi:hypothetical protein
MPTIPTIEIPEPTQYMLDFRNIDTKRQVGAFALPYVPMIGDFVVINQDRFEVLSREWDLDEPDPETKPFVTLLVTLRRP